MPLSALVENESQKSSASSNFTLTGHLARDGDRVRRQEEHDLKSAKLQDLHQASDEDQFDKDGFLLFAQDFDM